MKSLEDTFFRYILEGVPYLGAASLIEGSMSHGSLEGFLNGLGVCCFSVSALVQVVDIASDYIDRRAAKRLQKDLVKSQHKL